MTAPHLGGHMGVTHVDAGVFDHLVERYAVRTLLDVGCGPGGMLDLAAARGVAAWGVDGDPACARPGVTLHDYTAGPLAWSQAVDLAWCVEFAEHVAAVHIPNWLATLRAARVLLFSHALPGQPGWHHVTCEAWPFWEAILRADGWYEVIPESEWVRRFGSDRYVRATGRVLIR